MVKAEEGAVEPLSMIISLSYHLLGRKGGRGGKKEGRKERVRGGEGLAYV